jgi:hypothetical protein
MIGLNWGRTLMFTSTNTTTNTNKNCGGLRWGGKGNDST